ncbi:MAG: alpha/beta hydrolase family protein [Planctomycetota bacterium]|jgi:pimeloyl-ACP methyl ester carboxylesterase
MRPAATFFVLLLALPASASSPDIEGGRFTVFAAGREAGGETVTVRKNGSALVVESRARLSRADRTQELELSFCIDLRSKKLLSFRARGIQADRERVVTLAAKDGRLIGEIREGESARALDLPAEEGAVPIADPFAAPYLVLLSRYDLERGGSQTFPALFPLEGQVGGVTLRLKEEQALELDGRAVIARRIRAEPEHGEAANLWIDGSARLLVCARSVAGLSAVRGRALRIGLKPGDDPPDPEGVSSIRIRFAGEGITLAGTVSRPAGSKGPFPAVVLVSGSGPQDRNGNVPGAELQWNHLHSIAVALGREGIASIRYDERGVGRSSGRFYDAGVTDLLDDARSAIAYLVSRDDIDRRRIGLVGHSEGALLGALLSSDADLPIRGLVLLGAPAEPLDRILIGQVRRRLVRRGSEPREAQRILGDLRAFFEHVRLARSDVVKWKGRSREARWLRQHMEIDPKKAYAGVRCPALVLHGGRDEQVPSSQAAEVLSALGERGAGLTLLATLDHFLMPSRGGLTDYSETRRRVDPAALDRITSWLLKALR